VSPGPGLPGKGCAVPGHNQLPTPEGSPDTPAVGASLLMWSQMPVAISSPCSSQLFRDGGHPKKNH